MQMTPEMMEMIRSQQAQAQKQSENPLMKKYNAFCEDHPSTPALVSMAKNFGFFIGSIALIRTFGDKLNVDGGL